PGMCWRAEEDGDWWAQGWLDDEVEASWSWDWSSSAWRARPEQAGDDEAEDDEAEEGPRTLRVDPDLAEDPREQRFLELMDAITPDFQIWERRWDSCRRKYYKARYEDAPFQPCEPCAGLLLGDLDNVKDCESRVALNVATAVCLCPEQLDEQETATLRDTLHTHQIELQMIAANDDWKYDILQHLPSLAATVEAALAQSKKVLVSCWAGVNRSAALVVGYMNLVRNVPLLDAFRETVRLRGEIVVNGHFRSLLARAALSKGETPGEEQETEMDTGD
ncbi:MAG: dual specificity protein phosphatase family protein, partial [bacterium]|nr:dual specificity protein phosphatase family protein [bacterium]